MRLLLSATLLLAACHFDTTTQATREDGGPGAPDADPLAPDADPTLPDADPFVPDAAPCAEWAYTPSLFIPCDEIQEVNDSIVLNLEGVYTYDTFNGTLLPPVGTTPIPHTKSTLGIGARAPRVINTSNFVIAEGSILRATGSRPLLIVSWNSMTIAGEIDVTSQATDDVGAGGSADQCAIAGDGAYVDDQGGGGGGGGGFGAAGGVGGAGQNALINPGGDAGVAKAVAFHGGCAGGRGGLGDGVDDTPELINTERGLPGQGGGAVFLSARTTLGVSGTINAGGMGGGGAQNNRAAGGGGGSGGLIALEANSITLSGDSKLAANGGGGGGGGNNTPSLPGSVGLAANEAAPGGEGDPNKGGDGGFLEVPEGLVGATGSRGGGGGGGGVGFIVLLGNQVSALAEVISPAQQTTTIGLPSR